VQCSSLCFQWSWASSRPGYGCCYLPSFYNGTRLYCLMMTEVHGCEQTAKVVVTWRRITWRWESNSQLSSRKSNALIIGQPSHFLHLCVNKMYTCLQIVVKFHIKYSKYINKNDDSAELSNAQYQYARPKSDVLRPALNCFLPMSLSVSSHKKPFQMICVVKTAHNHVVK